MLPQDELDDLPDEVVEEVRTVRRAHAEALGFDLTRMFEDAKMREIESGVPVISLPPRPLRTRAVAVDRG